MSAPAWRSLRRSVLVRFNFPSLTGPLYRLTIWPPVAALAPPGLGIARAAIEETIELATRKTPAYMTKTLKDGALRDSAPPAAPFRHSEA